MADTAEAPTPAPAPAAAAAPSDAKTVELVRGPGGRFQKPRKADLVRQVPFEQRMAAAEAKGPTGGLPEDNADGDEEEAEAAPVGKPEPGPGGKPEPAAGKEPPAPPEPTEPEPKPAAKESFTKERLAFDEWRRRQREAHRAELAAERAQFDEERKGYEPRVQRAESIIKAYESNDPDALAKALGNHADWNELEKHMLSVLADPNYKRTRELERWKEEQEAKEARQRKEAEQRSQAERRAVAIRTHKQGLSATMAKSQDRVVAAMADDPQFVDTVFALQGQYYRETGGELSPEQAIRYAMRGQARPVLEHLAQLKDRLSRAFAESAPEPRLEARTEPAAPEPPKPKPPKSAPVPPSATPEPAANGSYKGPRDPAWRKRFSAAMDEAFDEEERAKGKRRKA